MTAALAVALFFAAGPADGGGHAPAPVEVVRIETDAGVFAVRLNRAGAPRHAAAFAARACGPAGPPLVGSVVCRKQPGGYVTFGCAPAPGPYRRPRPPAGAPRIAPEIDAVALGLDRRRLDDPALAGRLWDEWIAPRALRLRARGRPDRRLEAWIAARAAPARRDPLLGRSLREIYEAIGFRYRKGLSGRRLVRGAVADATLGPEGGDGRFLVALEPIPEREGRTTVFGEVVAGIDVIEAISRLPTNRTRAPAVRVTSVHCR